MIEGLFVLTTVFIAYVVYQIANEPKANVSETLDAQVEQPVAETPAEPESSALVAEVETVAPQEEAPVEEVPVAAAVEQVVAEAPIEEPAPLAVTEVVAPEETSAPAEAIASAPEAEIATAAAQPPSKAGLKNPKTSEVVLVYNNYRFLKRWIKEALVSEGLLPKIYKNNELNAATETKIKAALEKLEAIDKYRV